MISRCACLALYTHLHPVHTNNYMYSQPLPKLDLHACRNRDYDRVPAPEVPKVSLPLMQDTIHSNAKAQPKCDTHQPTSGLTRGQKPVVRMHQQRQSDLIRLAKMVDGDQIRRTGSVVEPGAKDGGQKAGLQASWKHPRPVSGFIQPTAGPGGCRIRRRRERYKLGLGLVAPS